MKTDFKYLIFAIVCIFFVSGKTLSQENNGDHYYMINPGHFKIIKSIKSNNSKVSYPCDGSICHYLNGDTISFVNNGNSMIGYQISPDISVPNANRVITEFTGDPSIETDPSNRYKIFTAGTATIYMSDNAVNGIDQEFGSFNGSTWNWSGGIFNPPPSSEGISWFNPAVRIYKRGSSLIYYTGSVMAYPYINRLHYSAWGLGQGITYSTDGGASWTNKMIQLADDLYDLQGMEEYYYFLDNNHLAVDTNSKSPYCGRVYSAWTVSAISQNIINYEKLGEYMPPFGKIEFKYSLDGMTWDVNSDPVNISDDTVMNYGVNLQIGNNGEVFAVWAMYGTNPGNDYQPPYGPEFALGFTKSLDGGKSFDSVHVIINNIRGINDDEHFFNPKQFHGFSFPSMCVDRSIVHPGRIYVAWSNIGSPGIDTGNYADIYVFYSDNQGASWSTPKKINTYNSYNFSGQYKYSVMPWITCDNETGKVCVIFYDDRNYRSIFSESYEFDPRFDTYVSMSKDGGATWEESHTPHLSKYSQAEWAGINDSSFCSLPLPPNKDPFVVNDFFSFYNGISVRDGVAYPIWTTNTATNCIDNAMSHPYITMSPYYIWNCIPDTVLFNYKLLSNDVKKFECQNYISTYDSVTISANAFSFFDAGDSITMHPGFHAEANCYFHAYIDGCIPFDLAHNYYSFYSPSSDNDNIYKTYLYNNLIKVYPNPTSGYLTVQLGEFTGTDGKLVLLNALNETILELNPMTQTTYRLDLTNSPRGIYFIKLLVNNRTYINKIMLY